MLFQLVSWLLCITNIAGLFHRLNIHYDIPLLLCRKWEKLNRKIVKLRHDVAFLDHCSKHGYIPKFLSLQDRNNLLPAHTIKERQLRKIAQLVQQHTSKLKHLSFKRDKLHRDIFSKAGIFDQLLFVKFFTRENAKLSKRIKAIHDKKLHALWLTNNLRTPGGTVRNLSSLILNQDKLIF